jgi:hypothetical protein
MKYSLPGYKIAVKRRSAKTLLVEGVDDQKILQRLMAARDDGTTAADQRPVVDHAHLVEDPVLSGLGNRRKVIEVSREADIKSSKFLALVDREWDGFDDSTFDFAPQYGPSEYLLERTKGHSVENYFFAPEFFTDYLLREHPEHITHALRAAIKERFPQMVWLATHISLAAREAELLGAICPSISNTHVRVENAAFCLDTAGIAAALTKQGCDVAKVLRFVNAFTRLDATPQPASYGGRWVAHGHVGSSTIWSCVGALALELGCSPQTAQTIAVGFLDHKLRAFAHLLAESAAAEKSPLDKLAAWAYRR